MNRKQPLAGQEPANYPAWRVLWCDWRGHHDWVGRGSVKRGGFFKKYRTKPPPRHAQDFLSREGAESFVAKLRREISEDDLVVQIVGLRSLRPLPPVDQLLPGSWPLQRRGD
jgi:hypothetical protein